MSQWQTADIPQRFTRRYCAARLLALGPLNLRAFRSITGWTESEAKDVLAELVRAKVIAYRPGVNQGFEGRLYYLVEA